MEPDARVCDADTLLRLCLNAEKYQFNRQAVTEILAEEIDRNGIHMVGIMVPYHRASFGPSQEPVWPDHHRCQVFAKVKGKDEPAEFFLDVAVKDFEALMPAQAFLSKMQNPIETGIADVRAAENDEEYA